MKAPEKFLNNPPAQIGLGGCLLGVMVWLLVMASKTGEGAYNEARQRLDSVEVLGLRMNGAMYPVLFEFQMDFDALTDTERDLRIAVEQFESSPHNPGAVELAELMRQTMTLMEDFKSVHAIFRNSRAIMTQMLAELAADPELQSPAAAEAVHAVDSAFLNFIGRRDPPSGIALREAIARVAAGHPEIAGRSEWRILATHSESLVRQSGNTGQLMFGMISLPIPQAIMTHRDRLQTELGKANIVAGRYRMGLFAIAVVLLAFGGLKATQVTRYVRMLNRANDELEHRVRDRTKELSEANLALLAEITERERVEDQLRIAQKLESIGQMAAGIAHEINTPTQYVNDNVSFVLDAWQELQPLVEDCERGAGQAPSRTARRSANLPFLRREIPKALKAAAGGLERIRDVVLAMKEFSHPGGDALVPSDINRAIDNAIVVASNEWKYVAEVETDLDPNLPRVPCDLSALHQVMLNLIVNAAQAIAERPRDNDRGHIKVSTRPIGDQVEICVEDDGPGVSEAIQDRIFDPFFTTKEVGKGTGQGLAIAYRVVTQQHRGTLTLERASGRSGARFVIRLPLKAPESRAGALALSA